MTFDTELVKVFKLRAHYDSVKGGVNCILVN